MCPVRLQLRPCAWLWGTEQESLGAPGQGGCGWAIREVSLGGDGEERWTQASPSVPVPAHQRILESADTECFGHARGSPQASLQALALPAPPLQCLLLLPSAVAAPAEHLTPTPLHPIPPSLFLVLLSPCLGSCCSLPDISSHAASVKHSLLIPLHGGLGTHSVQRPSPVDPNLTTGT